MGSTKLTFKRYEKKYLLSADKYEALFAELADRIEPDEYFDSTVCSIYYDTENYELIRRSIEKPVYKEKLRVRSYNAATEDSKVFVELKKKYKGVVYKRRVSMKAREAEEYLALKAPAPKDSQIVREIDWFLKTNRPVPKALIACDREAYVAKDDHELRITFDRNIRWRDHDLSLTLGDGGEPVTAPGEVLMEIKIPGAAPIWLAKLLSEHEVFPTSFSKYGTAYKNEILDKYMNGVLNNA